MDNMTTFLANEIEDLKTRQKTLRRELNETEVKLSAYHRELVAMQAFGGEILVKQAEAAEAKAAEAETADA